MFNYLTSTKNLHNLLWIYSPDQSRANPSRYYPGDAYVDIVALDVYTDDPVGIISNIYIIMINIFAVRYARL
jgi:beta-mannanase